MKNSSTSSASPSEPIDLTHMQAALALARRGLGRVAPNPAVGCVLVKEGRIVARGWTQPGGRPHAEAEALARAGAAARGACAYVTLEPCAHQGRTGPCADALVAAGIARCVVALEDPDPRVAGAGLARLRKAGVEVALGTCGEAAAELNEGYLLRQRSGRPLVTLKLATSLDGRIAARGGASRWITGEAARAHAHLQRARHDAVLVGSGTAVTDNPRLDVRLPGFAGPGPIRVVLDGRLRLPLTHDLVVRAPAQPTWLVTRRDGEPLRLQAYRDAAVEVLQVEQDAEGHLSLAAALRALGERGLTRLLVEGGGAVAAGLLRCNLVDRLIWYRAARVIGGDGVPAVAGFGVASPGQAPGFVLRDCQPVGDDLVETYRRAP